MTIYVDGVAIGNVYTQDSVDKRQQVFCNGVLVHTATNFLGDFENIKIMPTDRINRYGPGFNTFNFTGDANGHILAEKNNKDGDIVTSSTAIEMNNLGVFNTAVSRVQAGFVNTYPNIDTLQIHSDVAQGFRIGAKTYDTEVDPLGYVINSERRLSEWATFDPGSGWTAPMDEQQGGVPSSGIIVAFGARVAGGGRERDNEILTHAVQFDKFRLRMWYGTYRIWNLGSQPGVGEPPGPRYAALDDFNYWSNWMKIS